MGISYQLVPWPTWRSSLPVVIPRNIYLFIRAIPGIWRQIKRESQMKKEYEEQLKREEEEQLQLEQEFRDQREEAKRIRKENQRKKREQKEAEMMSASPAVIPQWSSQSNQTSSPSIDELEAMYDEEEENEEYNTRKKKNKKQQQRPWGDDDVSMLASLMNKYPGGYSNRWAVIARDLDRTVADVTTRANKSKQAASGKPSRSGPTATTTTAAADKNVVRQRRKPTSVQPKNVTNDITISFERAAAQAEAMEAAAAATAAAKVNLVEEWDQKQQKILEQALVSFPRTVEERWVKIAECLPGKSKEYCMKRYKYLSSKVLQARKTKAAAAAAAAVKS